MANQYFGSFEHKVQERFNCSALEMLKVWAEKGNTYAEVEATIGISHGTIRKWARRYGLELKSGQTTPTHQERLEQFYDPNLNIYNFLSRRWETEELELETEGETEVA